MKKELVDECKVGQEKFSNVMADLNYVVYNYRHMNGQLFTTNAPNLTTARARRDTWLKQFSKPIASTSVKELMLEAQKQIDALTMERNRYYSLLKYLETDDAVPEKHRNLIAQTIK